MKSKRISLTDKVRQDIFAAIDRPIIAFRIERLRSQGGTEIDDLSADLAVAIIKGVNEALGIEDD